MRILPKPPAARALADRLRQRARRRADCVAAIIAAGIIPGGMEIHGPPGIARGRGLLSQPGYPLDAEALLIVELDGPEAEVDSPDRGASSEIARDCARRVVRE